MKELQLKYGCNPNQKPSRVYMADGSELPIEVLNGRPGYINLLDALNSWQLVRELRQATGLPSAASFKHVSPAGAAVGLPLSDTLKHVYFVDDIEGLDQSPIACAYARARGADRMSSYGDFIALSDTCDKITALIIKREVSDGVIAPAYTDEALQILREKRKGTYNVIQIAADYKPAPIECKQVYGVTFEQGRNEIRLDDPALLENIPTKNKELPAEARRDLMIALITLKYTSRTAFATSRTARPLALAPVSRAASTAPVWPVRRPTSGGCVSTRRCSACPSCLAFAAPTATTPSTSTFRRTSTTTCCATASGSSSSPASPRCSRWPRSANGLPRTPA